MVEFQVSEKATPEEFVIFRKIFTPAYIRTERLTEEWGTPDIHTNGKTNRRGGGTPDIHTYGKTNIRGGDTGHTYIRKGNRMTE